MRDQGVITVNLTNELSTRFGHKSIKVPGSEKPSLRTVLEYLRDEVDPWFSQFLSGEGRTSTGIVQIIANGKVMNIPDDLDKELKEGSEVYLIPPIQGG